jgi:alpha-ketoglutarate-dependent taurine dioxygenase
MFINHMAPARQPCALPPVLPASTPRDALLSLLAAPPYAVVLRADPPDRSREWSQAIVRALGDADARLSFTRVHVDPASAAREGAVTRYSRTADAMPLHTDAAFSRTPPALVGFHMIAASPCGGGVSSVVPIDAVLAMLSPAHLDRLRQPVGFGRHALPVLFAGATGPAIRYYAAQLDHPAPATRALDDALAMLEPAHRFPLLDGDLLLVNNRKALHGRTGFSPDSPRRMLRYRIACGLLG